MTSAVTTRPRVPSTEVDEPAVQPGRYDLSQGQPVPVGGSVELELVELTEDSRCPLDAECIWEGELTATVIWSDPDGAEEVDLTWSVHADPSPGPDGAWVLALDDATRQPDDLVVQVTLSPA